MTRTWKLVLAVVGIAAIATFPVLNSEAQTGPGKGGGSRTGGTEEATTPEKSPEVLSPQVREAQGWASEFSREAAQIMEKWIESGAVTEDKLFAFLYYPVLDTDPTKYTTDYDGLADRDFVALQERFFSKTTVMLYAVISDKNGYVPTHNRQYSQPLTGNPAVDLVSNRTKRLFGDTVGFRASRNQETSLVQQYKRDTGEAAVDVSVPLKVKGKHWGCIRIGFRQTDR